jgi:hypothetical protein
MYDSYPTQSIKTQPTYLLNYFMYVNTKWLKYLTTSKMIKMLIKITKIPSNDQ